MDWARLLAYITGTVDQELLLRNEYLAAENRILKAQIKDRLLLTVVEKATLAVVVIASAEKRLKMSPMQRDPIPSWVGTGNL